MYCNQLLNDWWSTARSLLLAANVLICLLHQKADSSHGPHWPLRRACPSGGRAAYPGGCQGGRVLHVTGGRCRLQSGMLASTVCGATGLVELPASGLIGSCLLRKSLNSKSSTCSYLPGTTHPASTCTQPCCHQSHQWPPPSVALS